MAIEPYGDPDWWRAKKVIEAFLVDFCRPATKNWSEEEMDHASSALIARLSHAELLVVDANKKYEPDAPAGEQCRT